ncbi:hypothetical protein G6F31_020693 [Rhizopus arrhizus]|nr:hypothetical protein G6F31_020693 [Rhizopus arrhizus]
MWTRRGPAGPGLFLPQPRACSGPDRGAPAGDFPADVLRLRILHCAGRVPGRGRRQGPLSQQAPLDRQLGHDRRDVAVRHAAVLVVADGHPAVPG